MKNVTSLPRPCEKCGQDFLPRSNFAKFCDACCTHVCEWCGKQFDSRRRRNVRFCSVVCTNAWQTSPSGRDQHHRQKMDERGNGKLVNCETCGKEQYRQGARSNAKHFYCSNECRRLKVELVCPICGKTFSRPPSDLRSVNYCSDDCRNTGTMERVASGEIYAQSTQLEIAGRAILERIGVPFQEQQPIGGKFMVDVLYPEQRVVIQWDGDFWHGNRDKFSALTEVQQANMARDKKCNTYLAKCGYTVLRFWETDVHSSPEIVADAIRECLASSSST